jgi:chemotaxis signal transduction protein
VTAKGGVVVRIGERAAFVPADVAVRIAPPPPIARVPGAPPELLGVAMHEGAILPVISIGPERERMIVCRHAGELLGLVGGVVERTGLVDESDAVEVLDVAAIYARIQTGGWMARWGG